MAVLDLFLITGLGDERGEHVTGMAASLDGLGHIVIVPSVVDLGRTVDENSSLNRLVDRLGQIVRSEQSAAARTVLVGYSIGGTVAYALAARMRAAGHGPALLVMIDSSAAYPPARRSLLREIARRCQADLRMAAFIAPLLILLRLRLRQGATYYTRRLARLASPRVFEEAKSLLLIDFWVTAMSSADLPRYDGDVVLLKASKGRPRIVAADLGWSSFATSLDVRTIAGTHWSIVRSDETRAQVVQAVTNLLATPEPATGATNHP